MNSFASALYKRLDLRLMVWIIAVILLIALCFFDAGRAIDMLLKITVLFNVGIVALHLHQWFAPYARPHLFMETTDTESGVKPGCEQLYMNACDNRNRFICACLIAAALTF